MQLTELGKVLGELDIEIDLKREKRTEEIMKFDSEHGFKLVEEKK